VNVIDAKTMSPDPVAVVELPNRVPYGFHAFFVNEVLESFSCSFLIVFGGYSSILLSVNYATILAGGI
jgi:hypothetical protein